MLSPLDRADGPLYRQAASRLREAIVARRLLVGTALPTEAALAAGFGVSLITVRQALRELEQEGLIRKRPAKAAVVAASGPRPAARDLNSFEDIIAAASGARLEIFGYAPRRSAAAAAAVFGLPASTPLHRLHGRMVVESGPVSEITIFFPPAIGRRLRRADFDDVVVFRSVERRLGIRLSGARITVSAEAADEALAGVLDCSVGDPVLTNRMLYYDADGVPVEFTIARHRADRYSLTYDLGGNGPRGHRSGAFSTAAFTQLVSRPSRR